MSISVTDALDGSVHEFPDGTSPDIIKGAMARTRAQSQKPVSTPQESFGQEFSRTRREQMAVANEPPVSFFDQPGKALTQSLGRLNYPLAAIGISPALETAGRRWFEQPISENLQYYLKMPKPVADTLGRTANLAAQMFLPGPAAEKALSALAPAKTLARLAKGEQYGREAAQTEREAAQLSETAIPKATKAGEALEGKLKQAQRGLKAGEAQAQRFPSTISPRQMTPTEAGTEYGGGTVHPTPRLEELGLYGQQARGASEHFKTRYGEIRSELGDIKVPAKDLDEIKAGVFEGAQRHAAYNPQDFRVIQDILNKKSSPEQLKSMQQAMAEAEKQGKSFGIADLALVAGGKKGEVLSGREILDRVQILRNQGRASASDLVEFMRNDLADKYMQRLTSAVQEANKGDTLNKLQAVNQDYRTSRTYFGKGAIPRLTADQYASDILGVMFGPGKGSVERARTMRQFIPKENFDAYVRSFTETMFNPQDVDKTMDLWRKMPREQKIEMYGEPHANQLDRIFSGIEKDRANVGKMEAALTKVQKFTGGLEKQLGAKQASAQKLAQQAKAFGYVIDPNSRLGQAMESAPGKALKFGAFGFSGFLGFEHVGRGLTDLAMGNKSMAMLQFVKAAMFISPTLLPDLSKTVRGAKLAADVLHANPQDVWAALALRKFLADNGVSEDQIMSQIGLRRGSQQPTQNQAGR